MRRVYNFLVENRVLVVSYLEDKNLDQDSKLVLSWWIVTLCLHAVAKVLTKACSCLRVLITLLIQQHALFKELCVNLSEMCMVTGLLSKEHISQIDPAVPCVRRYEYAVTCTDALAFVRD